MFERDCAGSALLFFVWVCPGMSGVSSYWLRSAQRGQEATDFAVPVSVRVTPLPFRPRSLAVTPGHFETGPPDSGQLTSRQIQY